MVCSRASSNLLTWLAIWAINRQEPAITIAGPATATNRAGVVGEAGHNNADTTTAAIGPMNSLTRRIHRGPGSSSQTTCADKLAAHHDYVAIDIPVPVGTPYYAITAGKVTYTSPGNGCGTGVQLHGLDGVTYTYCHGSKRLIAAGLTVPPGTELGLTGNTGHSFGPHLHLQILYAGKKRCPQALLWDLYDGIQPPPDAHAVQTLPTRGCSYIPKK